MLGDILLFDPEEHWVEIHPPRASIYYIIAPQSWTILAEFPAINYDSACKYAALVARERCPFAPYILAVTCHA